MDVEITLTANEDLISRARAQAAAQNTTLEVELRRWLAEYARAFPGVDDFETLMESLRYVRAGAGNSRDELNAR